MQGQSRLVHVAGEVVVNQDNKFWFWFVIMILIGFSTAILIEWLIKYCNRIRD